MPQLEDVLAELAAIPQVQVAALGGADGLLVDEVFSVGVDPAETDMDGAVVEFTYAWNALQRAVAEPLAAGATQELMVVAQGGQMLVHAVGDAWYVMLWASHQLDLPAARLALAAAAVSLTEVVA